MSVVIVDGDPNLPSRDEGFDPKEEALAAAELAKEEGIKMLIVAVTGKVDEELARDLSSTEQELYRDYFTVASFSDLEDIRGLVTQEACAPTPTEGTYTYTSQRYATTRNRF